MTLDHSQFIILIEISVFFSFRFSYFMLVGSFSCILSVTSLNFSVSVFKSFIVFDLYELFSVFEDFRTLMMGAGDWGTIIMILAIIITMVMVMRTRRMKFEEEKP